MNFPTEHEQVLTCGNTQIGVIPHLCLVSHFQVGNWPILYRPSVTQNVKRWGIPLMIPNFGRLSNGLFQEKGTTLPMHGFGRNLPWTVVQQDQHKISLQLSANEATLAVYPYAFVFTATIEVSLATLTYVLEMENRSDEVMPVAPGFHPYFAVAQSKKADIVTTGPEGFSARSVQWETQPPDQAYPFPHQLTVEMPDAGSFTIAELPVDGHYSLRSLQIWSEPVTAPDHDFVCFEPIVTPENGLNRPADRLNILPNHTHQITLQLTARPA